VTEAADRSNSEASAVVETGRLSPWSLKIALR
jgi:hypothetical protein